MFSKKRAYFDYASTTPLDPRVFAVMEPYLKKSYANPSSLYKEGVEVKRAIEEARKRVANVLQSKPEEVLFTSGGTEGNNLAILGTYFYHKNILKKEKIHFVTTSIEHASVIEAFEYVRSLGAKVTYVSPEENGIVSPKKIEEALHQETVLVSVMYANNEIGTIQLIKEISKILKTTKVCKMVPIMHVDACQGGSYVSLLVNELGVDLLVLDGSKIYGPKSSGVLFKKRSVEISPILFGGGQEGGLRSGTENAAAIIGFAEALMIAQREKTTESRMLYALRNRLLKELVAKIPGMKINGDLERRLPNNINICIPGLDAEYAVLRMDALGFCISSVTSCKTLSEDSSSYVIEELYGDQSCSKSSLRITLGRFTKEKEVRQLIEALLTVIHR